MKKWRCTVCNYIHEGAEPPEQCPICGAAQDKFVEVEESETAMETSSAQEAEAAPPTDLAGKLTAIMVEKHLHPISVHGPNGIIPMVVLFLALAVVLQFQSFGNAAYLSMIFVLLSLPPVLVTGYFTWIKKYNGEMTPLFKKKIGASAVATILLCALVFWKTVRPDILTDASLDRFIFLFWSVVMLGAVGLAGHLGGQLVFGAKK